MLNKLISLAKKEEKNPVERFYKRLAKELEEISNWDISWEGSDQKGYESEDGTFFFDHKTKSLKVSYGTDRIEHCIGLETESMPHKLTVSDEYVVILLPPIRELLDVFNMPRLEQAEKLEQEEHKPLLNLFES